ncbi:DUF732 domain-containing protein [Mycobacterium avium]|jgi:hypothetical protein|uniref:DUF732 domain-containing protein n=1 Tax=Mycobacterium avium TaxID=1764 RepID=UPI0009BE9A91|nr:DUF732 domain-containing protein [Mycobacterium avium]
MFLRVAIVIAASIFAPAIGPASPAHADPQDAYIAELQRRGVDYSTPEAAITMGEAACQALRDGNSVVAVVNTIQGQGFTAHDSGIIVGAAANTFCPDQLSTIQGFIDNHSE